MFATVISSCTHHVKANRQLLKILMPYDEDLLSSFFVGICH